MALPDEPSEALGSCLFGVRTCDASGEWSACVGAVAPLDADSCDPGADENCNGVPNEDCPCTDGDTRSERQFARWASARVWAMERSALASAPYHRPRRSRAQPDPSATPTSNQPPSSALSMDISSPRAGPSACRTSRRAARSAPSWRGCPALLPKRTDLEFCLLSKDLASR